MRIFCALALYLLLSTACSSVKNVQARQPKTIDPDADSVIVSRDDDSPLAWESLFRRVPGVQVRGQYPDLSLLIRGAKSMQNSTEPLFVLEGVPLGRNFRDLAQAANPNEIASIKVLKGTAAGLYGARGANGVIVVRLKE